MISGPDNILAVRARVRPETIDGVTVFRASGLPAGRYRVTVMGAGGASLDTRPDVGAVTLDGTGVRLDFRIAGRL